MKSRSVKLRWRSLLVYTLLVLAIATLAMAATTNAVPRPLGSACFFYSYITICVVGSRNKWLLIENGAGVILSSMALMGVGLLEALVIDLHKEPGGGEFMTAIALLTFGIIVGKNIRHSEG